MTKAVTNTATVAHDAYAVETAHMVHVYNNKIKWQQKGTNIESRTPKSKLYHPRRKTMFLQPRDLNAKSVGELTILHGNEFQSDRSITIYLWHPQSNSHILTAQILTAQTA